jgi:5-oxopent-3-ene-1,2,5-tricarboxylate decarboxylase/2-hydroxyhepta-2,4-diene-1,7-dioate isomerase
MFAGTPAVPLPVMAEYRRILLDGVPAVVTREDDDLVTDDGRRIPADGATHLAPAEPTKIIAVHLNYRSRVEEFMTRLPPAPTYFHKPVTALNSHRGEVVRPPGCRYLNFEGEIAIVIGTRCRNVAPEEAEAHIAGYAIANDFGLHDFRDTDAGSMLRVKGSDTLCPVGPGVVTDWDFRGKAITTQVNGEVRQSGSTDEMVWDMAYLVADLARTITLLPGDMILSGTPAGSRPVEPGDIVTVSVEGLGELSNTIVEGPEPIRSDVGAQPSESEEVVSTALGGDWEHRGVRPPRAPASTSTGQS